MLINSKTLKNLVLFKLNLDNQFSGFGIKKMKAYKSNLPYDELQKLKAEFWSILFLN